VSRHRSKIISKMTPNGITLVKTARIIRGWTVIDLAARSGISHPTITAVENGKGTSVKTAHMLAGFLSRSFEELFKENGRAKALHLSTFILPPSFSLSSA